MRESERETGSVWRACEKINVFGGCDRSLDFQRVSWGVCVKQRWQHSLRWARDRGRESDWMNVQHRLCVCLVTAAHPQLFTPLNFQQTPEVKPLKLQRGVESLWIVRWAAVSRVSRRPWCGVGFSRETLWCKELYEKENQSITTADHPEINGVYSRCMWSSAETLKPHTSLECVCAIVCVWEISGRAAVMLRGEKLQTQGWYSRKAHRAVKSNITGKKRKNFTTYTCVDKSRVCLDKL